MMQSTTEWRGVRVIELPSEVLGSERLTGATLDRLLHRCRIIETKGTSYRLHDAKIRTRRTVKPTPVATATPAS